MEANDTLILLSLTQTEINAITSPDIGGMLYNSTTNTVQTYSGTVWENSSGGSGLDALETVTLDGGNIITPSQITSDVDDYNPTGFSTCNMIRQSISANNKAITGFLAPSAGVNRIIAVNNISSSGRDLKFLHNDSNSSAANRLYLRDNGDRTIRPNETAMFWYDHTSSRWRSYNRIG